MECAFRNISNVAGPRILVDSSYKQNLGDVYARDGSLWIGGCEQCYTVWNSRTRDVVSQGCWFSDISCQSTCTSDGVVGSGLEFCCCTGEQCNLQFSTGSRKEVMSTSSIHQSFSLVSLTAEEENMLTYILLGILGFLILALVVVIWRICKTCDSTEKKKQRVIEISSSQILLIPPLSSTTSSVPDSPSSLQHLLLPPSTSSPGHASSSTSSSPSPAFRSNKPSYPRRDDVGVAVGAAAGGRRNDGRLHYPQSFSEKQQQQSNRGFLSKSHGFFQNLYPKLHMTSFMTQNLLLSHTRGIQRKLDVHHHNTNNNNNNRV